MSSAMSELKQSTTHHFPTGQREFRECGVCLESSWIYSRACCGYFSCQLCLRQYYSSRIELAAMTIECINPLCHSYAHRDDIASTISPHTKDIYYRYLANSCSERTKTCPRCNHFHTPSDESMRQMRAKTSDFSIFRVQCSQCQYYWCFKCHAPWHTDMTCKQFLKGDRLLKCWAKETVHGQVNAQRCPKCKIYIERTTGCDHMHCTHCKTDFCYKCGDRLRKLKFFGDHYSKFSVFGCKYRFKADKPVERKLIRGALFAAKLMLVPLLGSLVLVVGAIVIVLGLAAMPVYVAFKIYRNYRDTQHMKIIRQPVVISTISNNNV